MSVKGQGLGCQEFHPWGTSSLLPLVITAAVILGGAVHPTWMISELAARDALSGRFGLLVRSIGMASGSLQAPGQSYVGYLATMPP